VEEMKEDHDCMWPCDDGAEFLLLMELKKSERGERREYVRGLVMGLGVWGCRVFGVFLG